MVTPYLVFLGLVAAERLFEVGLSRRHAAWAFERGGKEFGQGHAGLMKLLHGVFLFSSGAEVVLLDRPFVPVLAYPMLGIAVAAMALRYWAVVTLGRYWNIRVIVVPGAKPVTGGPYRFLRHPNYVAVIMEGLAIPLVHTAWLTALGFSLLNAWMLYTRIRCEENALATHCGYTEHLGDRRRSFPLRPKRSQRLQRRSA